MAKTATFGEVFAPAKTLSTKEVKYRNKVQQKAGMATDSIYDSSSLFSSAFGAFAILDIDGARGRGFLGYPLLAQLEQNPLISRIAKVMVDEATNRWVEFKGEKAKEGVEIFEKWNIEALIKEVAKLCYYYGGALLFIDTGETDLETPLMYDDKSIAKGTIKGLRVIEPVNVSPVEYNAYDPLSEHYFVNQMWQVAGARVHASRFLKFSTALPSIFLRPAYNFFGIPYAQKLLPYVEGFERARNASNDILDNFRLLGIKTNMGDVLNANGCASEQGAANIVNRLDLLMSAKDNNTAIMIDKDNEDFFEITTPLTGVEGITAQQLELLSLQPGIAVTSLFGTPPKGFNATGDNDIKNTEKTVAGFRKETGIETNVQILKNLLFLNEGLDPQDTTIDWVPLSEPNELERAQIASTEAQTASTLIQSGIISADEERKRLNDEEGGTYSGLLSDEPDEDDTTKGELSQILGAEETEAKNVDIENEA